MKQITGDELTKGDIINYYMYEKDKYNSWLVNPSHDKGFWRTYILKVLHIDLPFFNAEILFPIMSINRFICNFTTYETSTYFRYFIYKLENSDYIII